MLGHLTPRERMIVKWKFGIDCWKMEYEEIAKKWSEIPGVKPVTPERCRQIVVAAINKLRNM